MRSVLQRLFVLLAVWLTIGYPGLAQSPLTPPFRKVWTIESGDSTNSLAANDTTIFLGYSRSYTAYDRTTGKRLWQKMLQKSEIGTEIVLFGGMLYVAAGQGSLSACDLRTGKTQWSVPLKTDAFPFTVTEDTIYLSLQPNLLSALNRRTRRIRWSAPLPRSPNHLDCPPLVHDSHVFLAKRGFILALDRVTGRPLWKLSLPGERPASITGLALNGANRRLFAGLWDGRLMAIHTESGKVQWKFETPKAFTAPVFAGGRVYGMARDGWLYAVHADTGRLAWKTRLSRKRDPYVKPALLAGGQILTAADDQLYALNLEGKILWKWPLADRIDSLPLYRPSDGIIVSDTPCLYFFRPGIPPALPEIPAERRALAEHLVARLSSLSRDEHKTLTELGDTAFDALLPRLQKALSERHAALARSASLSQSDRDFGVSDIVYRMVAVMQPKHTRVVLALLHSGEEPRIVVEMLAERGDPAEITPFFLEILKRGRKQKVAEEDFEREMVRRAAVETIGNSSDPRAVAYLIEQLGDPDAPFDVRSTAYSNLARTGGAAGLKAVLAARDTSRELPTLAQMMALDSLLIAVPKERIHSGTRLVTTARDDNGVLWGLIQSPALGGQGDLWIARHDGEKWTQPVFTGVNPDARPLVPVSPKSDISVFDPKTILFAGLTEQDLIKDGGWFRAFIGNPELTRDSDGDGWTDVAERRVGTDSTRADTDSDGLPDSRDSNPFAAPRELTEEEAVLAATFESPISPEEMSPSWQPLLISLPKGMKPFEIRGHHALCIPVTTRPQAMWSTSDFSQNASVTNLYGQGIGFVKFAPPAYDLDGAANHTGRDGPVILWNADRTEAKVGVSLYYGPLAGVGYDFHLKKFDGVWVVIRQQVAYMS